MRRRLIGCLTVFTVGLVTIIKSLKNAKSQFLTTNDYKKIICFRKRSENEKVSYSGKRELL